MSKTVSRLYTSFQPDHYDLQLSLDIERNLAAGRVIIEGQKKGRPSQRLTLHGHGLTVTSATIIKHDKKQSSVEIPISRINLQKSLDEIRLHSEAMLYAGDYTVTVEFTAPIQVGMHGIYRSDYDIDGDTKTLISTQFESHHAREAFPCIDEPEAKASFQLTIAAPSDNTVLGNMPVSESTVRGELTELLWLAIYMSGALKPRTALRLTSGLPKIIAQSLWTLPSIRQSAVSSSLMITMACLTLCQSVT